MAQFDQGIRRQRRVSSIVCLNPYRRNPFWSGPASIQNAFHVERSSSTESPKIRRTFVLRRLGNVLMKPLTDVVVTGSFEISPVVKKNLPNSRHAKAFAGVSVRVSRVDLRESTGADQLVHSWVNCVYGLLTVQVNVVEAVF